MAYRRYGKTLNDDALGPIPPWAPDAAKRWKRGQPRAAFIWPRDKPMSSTPLGSWRRWKDVFLRKGPPIYIGDRTRFGPSRPTWSNWTEPEFDNLGYRDEHVFDMSNQDPRKKYDFRKRRWTKLPFSPAVWSDAKWGRDPRVPLYWRNGYGMEYTKRNGLCRPFDNTEWGNDFRYRPHMPDRYDWQRPWPDWFWKHADN